MRHPFLFFLSILLSSSFAMAQPATAPDVKPTEPKASSKETLQEYVRIRKNEKNVFEALETSIIRFGESNMYPGTTVDLIGAIHLGEKQYYKTLDAEFENTTLCFSKP